MLFCPKSLTRLSVNTKSRALAGAVSGGAAAAYCMALRRKIANVVAQRGGAAAGGDWQQQPDSINFCRPNTAKLTRAFSAEKRGVRRK